MYISLLNIRHDRKSPATFQPLTGPTARPVVRQCLLAALGSALASREPTSTAKSRILRPPAAQVLNIFWIRIEIGASETTPCPLNTKSLTVASQDGESAETGDRVSDFILKGLVGAAGVAHYGRGSCPSLRGPASATKSRFLRALRRQIALRSSAAVSSFLPPQRRRNEILKYYSVGSY